MSWPFLLVLAAMTIASRVLPMTLLPAPRGRLAELLESLPAPLFASLAALALVERGTPPPAVLAAALAALLGAARRSLGLTLAAGVAGFLLAQKLT